MAKQTSRFSKKLAGKAAEALLAIVARVDGANLRFLDKTVRFIAKHTRALIAFVAGLIGVLLM